MNFLISYLHFVSFFAYLGLSVYIFAKEPKSALNRLCFLAFLCFSIWSFAFIIIHHPATPHAGVRFWIDVSAVGGVLYPAFLYHFFRLLVYRKGSSLVFLFYSLALVLVGIQWATGELLIVVGTEPESYGWRVSFPMTMTTTGTIYAVYMYWVVGAIFYTLFRGWKLRPQSPLEKKQCRLMFGGGILVFAVLLFLDLLRTVVPLSASLLADTSFLIWAGCIVYAMVKYRLFRLTPITAADQIIRVMSDALFLVRPGGEVAFVNESASRLTRYSKQTLLDSNITSLLKDRFFSPARNVRNTCLHEDGAEIPILLSSVPLRGREEENDGHVVVVRDMSEHDRMESELAKAQKLEALGVFAGGIAHDLNNMLAGVVGFVDLARMAAAKSEGPIQEYLGKAQDSFPRLTDLTRQLLTFAKGGVPVKSVVDLNAVVTQSASLALSGSGIQEETHIDEDLWPVEIDPGQISQVINNLVINARQAMADNGRITIRCRNITDAEPSVNGLPRGHYILITITDTGPGIPEDLRAKIFDPFVTTKETGSGLGLSTCHSIMKRHNGAIRVFSEIGVGTTFSLVLPANPTGEIERTAGEKKSRDWKGKRCLLMDDDAAVRQVAAAMLRTFGLIITETRNGEDAAVAVADSIRYGTPFDFAIFDLTVRGGMGGVEAAEQVKKMDTRIPIIVSSGYSDIPVMENPEAYGFSVILKKPYQLSEMRKAIAKAIP